MYLLYMYICIPYNTNIYNIIEPIRTQSRLAYSFKSILVLKRGRSILKVISKVCLLRWKLEFVFGT